MRALLGRLLAAAERRAAPDATVTLPLTVDPPGPAAAGRAFTADERRRLQRMAQGGGPGADLARTWLAAGAGTREQEALEPCARVAPHYPKAGDGRPPKDLEMMLRIYCLQLWFNPSDPAVEDALYESLAMRRFAGIDLGEEPVPDETTLCRFRHLLERHALGKQLFEQVHRRLEGQGIRIARGTTTSPTALYSHGPGIDDPLICQVGAGPSASVHYDHQDGLGSQVALRRHPRSREARPRLPQAGGRRRLDRAGQGRPKWSASR